MQQSYCHRCLWGKDSIDLKRILLYKKIIVSTIYIASVKGISYYTAWTDVFRLGATSAEGEISQRFSLCLQNSNQFFCIFGIFGIGIRIRISVLLSRLTCWFELADTGFVLRSTFDHTLTNWIWISGNPQYSSISCSDSLVLLPCSMNYQVATALPKKGCLATGKDFTPIRKWSLELCKLKLAKAFLISTTMQLR